MDEDDGVGMVCLVYDVVRCVLFILSLGFFASFFPFLIFPVHFKMVLGSVHAFG